MSGVPAVLVNDAAEKSFLGACFLDPDVIKWADVNARCFNNPRWAKFFHALKAVDARGLAIDETTVELELQRQGSLEPVGGVPAIAELAMAVPTAQNVQSYIDLLHDRRVARAVWLLSGELRDRAERDEGDEALAWLVRRASEIDSGGDDSTKTLRQAVVEELRQIIEDIENEDRADQIPTGFIELDYHVGGIPIGQPALLGANAGVGKSATALAIARHCALHRGAAVIFTYEDRHRSWAQRVLAAIARVSAEKIRSRRLSREELGRLMEAETYLRSIPDNVYIVHAHGWRADRVVRKARAMKVTTGAELFVVDYIQRMPNPDPRQHRKREHAIRASLEQLSDFCGNDDVALLVLWQLTREYGKRMLKGEPPTYFDFADSSAAEQYGKFIMALWEPPDAGGSEIELRMVKNSQGSKGEFRLSFERQFLQVGERR